MAKRRKRTTYKRRKKNNINADRDTFVIVAIFLLLVVSLQIVNWALTHPYFLSLITVATLVIVALIVLYRRKRKKVSSLLNSSLSASPNQSINLYGSRLDQEFENLFLKSKPSENTKPLEWSLALIKSLDWKLFEELCAGFYQAKGLEAKVTNFGADGGIDIQLYRKSNPEKPFGIGQCKAWSKKTVGVREVRELLGVMTDAGCIFGVYFTTSSYTSDAKAFVAGKKIKLIDSTELLKMLRTLPMEAQTNLLEKITVGDYTTPSCPSCGTKLIVKTSKKLNYAGRDFWGCRNYPRCRYIMHIVKTK